jgi:hypothetical protein
MKEKYSLRELLEEIKEDEEKSSQRASLLSQADIERLIYERNSPKEENRRDAQ